MVWPFAKWWNILFEKSDTKRLTAWLTGFGLAIFSAASAGIFSVLHFSRPESFAKREKYVSLVRDITQTFFSYIKYFFAFDKCEFWHKWQKLKWKKICNKSMLFPFLKFGGKGRKLLVYSWLTFFTWQDCSNHAEDTKLKVENWGRPKNWPKKCIIGSFLLCCAIDSCHNSSFIPVANGLQKTFLFFMKNEKIRSRRPYKGKQERK